MVQLISLYINNRNVYLEDKLYLYVFICITHVLTISLIHSLAHSLIHSLTLLFLFLLFFWFMWRGSFWRKDLRLLSGALSLNISRNQLDSSYKYLDSLSSFQYLKTLNLSHNNFAEFPPQLYTLQSLVCLILITVWSMPPFKWCVHIVNCIITCIH